MFTETRFIIDSTHTDELGHLNHVWAIKLLEYARDDWYQKAGLWGGRPWSSDKSLGTIVVNINVNYLAECYLDEEVVVKTFPVEMGTKSYTLGQKLFKPDNSVAVTGQSTSVVMNMKEHTVIPVPDVMARYLPSRG